MGGLYQAIVKVICNNPKTTEDYSRLIIRCLLKETETLIRMKNAGMVVPPRSAPILRVLAAQFSTELSDIKDIGAFDRYHSKFMEAFITKTKESNGVDLSYGQAQKTVNIFHKKIIDQSGKPDAVTARRLKPFLHVPLNSVIMNHFRENYTTDYAQYISPVFNAIRAKIPSRSKKKPDRIPDAVFCKLVNIGELDYTAWQEWFRDIYPPRPILLDTIRALDNL